MKHHVLIFTTARAVGGGEIYVERVANGLHERFRISVLADRQILRRINASVNRFELSRFPRTIERNVPGGYRFKQIYHYFRHGMGTVFKRPGTDLVHFHIYDEQLLNLISPRLTREGIPQLITIHTEFGREEITKKKLRPCETLQRFSAVICVCNATKENLVSLGIPAEKCHVIHNGVDTKVFLPNKAPGRFITWVGRVDEQDKNAMLFVRIAELAHRRALPFQFRLVGDGPSVPFIREYVSSHGMQNLQLYGWAEDMREIYRDARVLCLTSTSEGLPLVLSEAMASGVPVVASNVGGVRELINDSSVGSLISSWKEEDFLEAIISLCGDSDSYASVRHNARAWVEQAFSLDQMLDEVAGLYTSLVEASPN